MRQFGVGARIPNRLCPLLLAVFMLAPGIIAASAEPTYESDADRTGGDYEHFDLAKPRPRLCQQACLHAERCRAWTYSHPGQLGILAICWLKEEVRPQRRNACCISGLK
jgi:hypothetical protein